MTPVGILIFFAVWTLLLVLAVVSYRTVQVLLRKAQANEFPASTPHGPDTYQRLCRAHQNAVENLPVVVAAVAAVYFTEASPAWLGTLGWVICGARVAQTSTHLASGGPMAVTLRAVFFLLQVFGLIALLGAAAAKLAA